MIWVDPLRENGWRLGPNAHLFADTREELHAFAAELGLRRSWYQAKPRLWHYDLTARRRAIAVARGAVEMSSRAAVGRALRRGD